MITECKYPTVSQLNAVVNNHGATHIIRGIVAELPRVAVKYNATPLHVALTLGQCAVESDHFKVMEEYASGDAYDTRTDLGNTPEKDGDGRLNKGSGLIQRTGAANLQLAADRTGNTLTKVRSLLKTDVAFALDDAFHYCMIERGRQMAQAANLGNIKILTKAVNGGYTHHELRVLFTRRLMLVLLGYGLHGAEIMRFQTESPDYDKRVDGKIGPATEKALFKALRACKWSTTPISVIPVGAETTSTTAQTPSTVTNNKKLVVTIGTGSGLSLLAVVSYFWDKIVSLFGG